MEWLVHYDTLHVFNALLNDESDENIEQKLEMQILNNHMKTTQSNLKFWGLTQISLALLADLCNKNYLIGE